MGTSENAVIMQIWTAMITMLLLTDLQEGQVRMAPVRNGYFSPTKLVCKDKFVDLAQ